MEPHEEVLALVASSPMCAKNSARERLAAGVELRPLRLVAPKRSEGGSPAYLSRRNPSREPERVPTKRVLAYAPAFGLRRVCRRFGPGALSWCGLQLQIPASWVAFVALRSPLRIPHPRSLHPRIPRPASRPVRLSAFRFRRHFKSQFYSRRLFAARRGYLSQSRIPRHSLAAQKRSRSTFHASTLQPGYENYEPEPKWKNRPAAQASPGGTQPAPRQRRTSPTTVARAQFPARSAGGAGRGICRPAHSRTKPVRVAAGRPDRRG